MKKLLLAVLATVTFSVAAPAWNDAVKLKEIWIVPGPTPIVRLMMDDGASNPYYAFYLTEESQASLELAQAALAANLSVKLYADKSEAPIFLSGRSAPYISQVTAVYPVYTLSVIR